MLKDLVELYPGDLISGSTRTDYNCVLEEVTARLKESGGSPLARRFVGRVEDVAARLDREFPGRYAETKKTIAGHIARAREMLRAKGPGPPPAGRIP